MGKTIRTDAATEAGIILAYQSGLTVPEAGARLGVCPATVSAVFKRNGFTSRRTIYSLNEDYFQAIDTEAKAYWLGFAAADGCLSDTASRRALSFSIGLAERDVGHLALPHNGMRSCAF